MERIDFFSSRRSVSLATVSVVGKESRGGSMASEAALRHAVLVWPSPQLRFLWPKRGRGR